MENRNQMPNVKSKTSGFSLLELILYIAILSGLMVVISSAFISLSRARGQADAKSEVNAAIRFAAERMRQDIKNASAVVTPVLGTASSTLQVTVGGVPVVYDVASGTLRRNENGAGAVAVTGTKVLVDAPTFTRLENKNSSVAGILSATTTALQISMTFRYNSSSTDWIYQDTLKTTATLR